VLALALLAPSSSGAAEAATPPTATSESPSLDVDGALARLVDDDAAARRRAHAELTKAGEAALPAFTKALAEQRKAPTPAVMTAVKTARDAGPDVPTALVETKQGGPGYAAATTTATLVQALAHIGTTPAVRQLVAVAVDHHGAFRPEVARELTTLADKAVPALIETRKGSPELRRFGAAQLESMGKRVPADAVQTQDTNVLVDVLRAFASVHDVDSLPVLLSFVNADRVHVRKAARDAVLEFGQDAQWKVREAYSNVTGKPAADGVPATRIANDLFAAYDRLRLQEVYALVDEGLAKEKDGKLDEAVADFDKVLARQPLLERRGEMVPAYFAYASKLEESDPQKARAAFEKAARLWPESPRAPHIQAELAYLDAKALQGRGVEDPEAFRRVLLLDPTHEKARAELTRFENAGVERQGRIRIYAAGATAVVVALLGLILFGGRRRPRRRAART
jgi:hypothetical protein